MIDDMCDMAKGVLQYHQNYYNQQVMMRNMCIFLLFIIPTVLSAARDCGNPSCFVKKLFDFTYPKEDIYSITLSFDQFGMNNSIKAYGDFNSDLRSDYVATDSNSSTLIFIFNSDNVYQLSYTLPIYQKCIPINYYLFDINGDGNLDITVWGQNGLGNCMYPIIQSDGVFNYSVINCQNFTTNTTQPSLFEFNLRAGGGTIKNSALLLYNNDIASRIIYYYQPDNGYQNFTWSQLFSSSTDYTSTPFSDWHWNTFIDITNDCYPDFVITNSLNQIQFWVFNSSSAKFFLSGTPRQVEKEILSLNIIDVNYDGGLDLILAQQGLISIILGINSLNKNSDFCVYKSYNFGFDWQNAKNMTFDPSYRLIQQNLQFADINVNGYPDMIVMVQINGKNTTAIVYQNQFQTGGVFEWNSRYTDKVQEYVNNLNIQTISFFDVLDNGIVDIFINVEGGEPYSLALYNNYLYQNFFYIKAYGTNGKYTSQGAQVPGISFYWLNSVGNQQRVSLCGQITQASYNSFPMPYVLTGLGRANNYVQKFTIGRLGEEATWSPIIPNSQLAIFSGNEPPSEWGIKIFIMPADSLISVIIVCIVILVILGSILAGIKIHRKRNEQNIPLLNDI